MEAIVTPAVGLASLALAAFLAATVLPLSSEVALYALLAVHPHLLWPALAVATLANTAGGMTTYAIGRWFGTRKPLTQLERVGRWGAPAVFFAWLPVLGDALVLAAGWLKVNWLAVFAFQLAGRALRYLVVAGTAT